MQNAECARLLWGCRGRASFGYRVWSLGLWSGFRHGQFDREAASVADGAAHQHAAAVGFNDVLHNAQADADALGLAAQLGAATVEAFEDLLVLGRRNAFAVVLDPEVDGCCMLRVA